MFCKYCGSEVPDKSDFCFRCGRNIKPQRLINQNPNVEEKQGINSEMPVHEKTVIPPKAQPAANFSTVTTKQNTSKILLLIAGILSVVSGIAIQILPVLRYVSASSYGYFVDWDSYSFIGLFLNEGYYSKEILVLASLIVSVLCVVSGIFSIKSFRLKISCGCISGAFAIYALMCFLLTQGVIESIADLSVVVITDIGWMMLVVFAAAVVLSIIAYRKNSNPQVLQPNKNNFGFQSGRNINQSNAEMVFPPAENAKDEADIRLTAKSQNSAQNDDDPKILKYISLIVYPIADSILYVITVVVSGSGIFGIAFFGPTVITLVIVSIIGSFLVYRLIFYKRGKSAYNKKMLLFAVLGTVIWFVLFFVRYFI